MNMLKRWLVVVVTSIAFFNSSVAVAQDTWPARAIRLVVPFVPGGNTDALARFLGEGLRRELGQVVVIENKPGAGGTIGGQLVAHAQGDGYTYLVGSAPQLAAISPLIKAGYDPVTDLAPVARLSDALMVIVARNDLPARSLKELAKVAAGKPEAITCGSAGISTVSHLHCEDLARQLRVKFLHVPYKGSNDAMTAVMAGGVDIVSNPFSVPQVRAGKAKALAAGTEQRHPELPEVPSILENGVDLGVPGWFGLAAPADTPAGIVNRMSAAVERVMAGPDAREALLRFGQVPAFLDARVFRETIGKDRVRLMNVERAAGLRSD